MHDTPLTSVTVAPGGEAIGAGLHPVPRQITGSCPPAKVVPSVAMQNVAVAHDSCGPKPRDGLALTGAQLVPFQVAEPDPPTAMQNEALMHDTWASSPGNAGRPASRHVVPFHASARFLSLSEVLTKAPTAMHREIRGHEIPGIHSTRRGRSTRHIRPFQDSAKPAKPARKLPPVPTARHRAGPAHEMPVKPKPPDEPGMLSGLQLVPPFHRTANSSPPLRPEPMTMQLVAEVQETPRRVGFNSRGGVGTVSADHALPFQTATPGGRRCRRNCC